MSEQIFWAVILVGALAMAAWHTVEVSRNPRDHHAWTVLVVNVALAAFATGSLWWLA